MSYNSNEKLLINSRFIEDKERILFFNFFLNKKNIALISHVDPDGDAIASLSAIYFICKVKSINAEIFLYNDLPFIEYNKWKLYIYPIIKLDLQKYDGLIFLDTPSLVRSGLDKEYKINIPSLCIDHHGDNQFFCELNIVAPPFCSTTEIILELIKNSDILEIDKKDKNNKSDFINCILESILMGILFDTYYFQTENVDFLLLERTAYLQKQTDSIHKLKNLLFKNQNPIIYKFWGNILSTINLYYNEQLVIAKADKKLFNEFKNQYPSFSDKVATEGFINHLMSLRNVSIAIFIREMEDITKVSIRSSIKVASALANKFGGGGHANAAAFTIDQKSYSTLEELERKIINVIEKDGLLNL